jgi:hypothetical protein
MPKQNQKNVISCQKNSHMKEFLSAHACYLELFQLIVIRHFCLKALNDRESFLVFLLSHFLIAYEEFQANS